MNLNENQVIEEYKKYIETKILRNSFDFDTWCQHQFGVALKNISVKPTINFSLVSKSDDK